ncbi:MAG: GGDEF domain-containing protein [Actinomycetota bacterium]|nr:GGDEF domain-containing protein [Actinomycetota bacterium]
MTNHRWYLSLITCAGAFAAAGVAFIVDHMALAAVALGAAVLAVAFSALQWYSMRKERELEDEITIDLRNPAPRLTTNDSVTGLIDRAYFRVTLSQRVASARRHLQPLSLVLFELDGFEKARPDRRDRAMRLLGTALRRTLRECDTACRYGDHAVAALLEDTPEAGAATAAERVRRAVTHTPTGRSFTLSAGIACYPSHALDAHDVLRRSVQALAAARAAGRDRVEIAGGD